MSLPSLALSIVYTCAQFAHERFGMPASASSAMNGYGLRGSRR